MVSDNIEQLAQMPNVTLGITPTVQVYNIFNLIELLKWSDYLNKKYKTKSFIDFLINVHPYHLSVSILPDNIRQQVAQELIDYRDNEFTAATHELTRNSTEGIIGLLQRPRAEDFEKQLVDFKDYTLSLDRARNQNIADIDNRLVELINGI
jgi:hypothetical protein